MPTSFLLLLRSIVTPFYRQNAGFFMFLFLVFFGVVAPSQQLAYHYALILGLLDAPVFLGIVLLTWFLYALKCSNWVTASLQSPEFSFLYLLSRLDKSGVFLSWLAAQIILFLPVSLYALAVSGVALHTGRYGVALLVQTYIILLCVAGAARYKSLLYSRDERTRSLLSFASHRQGLPPAAPYWSFFIRYFFHSNKALLLGLKASGCLILWLLLTAQGPCFYAYDIRMPFLIYSLVLFGHGVLIYRCRELEEKRLRFYRGLPVSWTSRFFQMMILYFGLLLPEMLTIGWLTPACIRLKDAFGFILSGYSVLLLLHSVLKIATLKMGDFLKLSLGIFGILYVCVLGDVLIALAGCFLVVAGGLFYGGYRSAGG